MIWKQVQHIKSTSDYRVWSKQNERLFKNKKIYELLKNVIQFYHKTVIQLIV